MPVIVSSIGDTVRAFRQAAEQFFDNLTQLRLGSLAVALLCFGAYMLVRSIASYNALRAAYPDARFAWRKVWGAYVAAYGLNGVVPAGGGSVVQLVLTRNAIPGASLPTVTSALCVGVLFDGVVCAGVLAFAFTQGVFPKPGDFGGLSSFDIAFFGRHPTFTIFLLTALAILGLILFAVLSRRVAELLDELRQGWAILADRRRYVTRMCLPQAGGWILRGAAYYYLLDAFRVGATLSAAILVLAVQVIAAIVPFTPGGAGVQQALLVVIFSSTAPTDSVAVFSVGQQIALLVFTLVQGFAAIFFIFRYRSFRALLRDSRAAKADS